MALVGIGTAAWYGPSQLMEAAETEAWQATAGRVEDARVVEQSRRRGRDYSVRIAYSYMIGGETYRGDQYAVTSNTLGAANKQQAGALARGYRRGDRITVFVDPTDPKRAVLARGGTRQAWATIGFGALLFLVGLFVGVRSLLRG